MIEAFAKVVALAYRATARCTVHWPHYCLTMEQFTVPHLLFTLFTLFTLYCSVSRPVLCPIRASRRRDGGGGREKKEFHGQIRLNWKKVQAIQGQIQLLLKLDLSRESA